VLSYLKKKQTLEESRLHACMIQTPLKTAGASPAKHVGNSTECSDKIARQSFKFDDAMVSHSKDVYLIEINQDRPVTDHLRFFFKDCEKKKEYYVIVYFSAVAGFKQRKIIFEHSNCMYKSLVRT